MKDFKKIFPIRHSLIIISLILTLLFACTGDKMETNKTILPSIRSISADDWQRLSQKKIYFGHQSVGFNIIDGIKDIMKTNPQIKLNIIETRNPVDLSMPAFAHSSVGKNTEPKSKCEAFAGLMNDGFGHKTDIAFLKFCYIDFSPATNIDELFNIYESTISALRTKYPQVIFIHITVPLTTPQTGLKALIKKAIGKSVAGYEENIKREEFNEKLRKHYKGKEPVFDLALIESTSKTGRRVTFAYKEKTVYSLAPEYTSDGGHLNEQGRKIVAEQLLVFLAKL